MLNSRNNHNFTYLEELSFLKYTKHVTVFFFTIFLLSTELNIVCNITDKQDEREKSRNYLENSLQGVQAFSSKPAVALQVVPFLLQRAIYE